MENYKCDLCGQAFTLRGHLKEHINSVHEGIKIINVNYVANLSADLETSHINIVHEEQKNYKDFS